MHFRKRLYILFTLLLYSFVTKAQVYPVSVSTIVASPGSVILSDYYSTQSTAFQSILIFNDFSEISADVRLRITIESNDIKIETKPGFIPVSPITLTPGVPYTLSGSDFYDYLNLPNIDLDGISYAALSNTGRIPEGYYNFCVEVLDYQTGIPISLGGCARFSTVEIVFLFIFMPQVQNVRRC